MGRKPKIEGGKANTFWLNLTHRKIIESYRVRHGLENSSEALRHILEAIEAPVQEENDG